MYGDVDSSIWPDISSRPVDTSLNDPPAWEEYLQAIKEMMREQSRGGRCDATLVEYIEFGDLHIT